MAITTRYFSTAAAGDEDGTSWANRAALLDGSGYFSSVITGFDFTSDSLICRIGPGTYTVGQGFTSGLFSVSAPTTVSPLLFHGCDASGNLLAPVDPDWKSSQPAWIATGIPLIDFGGYYSSLAYFVPLHINFTGNRSGYMFSSLYGAVWCQFFLTSSSTGAYISAASMATMSNCVFSAEGATAYSCIVQPNAELYNCRIVGAGASSGTGDRHGILDDVGRHKFNCTVLDIGGDGIKCTATNATRRFVVLGTTIANCGGSGINMSNSASPVTAIASINNCMITGCGAYGINANSQLSALVTDCRLRDNTSGNISGLGNFPTDFHNYITDSDDATEYVDPATGDYRIKNTATDVWGKGYGAGDEPVPVSGSGGGGLPVLGGSIVR